MNIWVAIFLFLHVMGAIIAFGPSYSFPIIGKMASQEPQHANFAARLNEAITEQRIIPLAIFQGITGAALIIVTGINLFATKWLLLGIALWVVALGYGLFVQGPVGRRIVELTSTPPPPGASGPPPELMANIQKAQRGGIIPGLLIVAIVILMVTKPQF